MNRPIVYFIAGCIFAVLFFEKAYAQSEYLPLDHDLNSRIGGMINSLSSNAHTSIQPYEVSRLGSSISYDSMITYKREYTYDGKSWIERKIFSEHLLDVHTTDYRLTFDFFPDVGIGYDLADKRMTWLHTRSFEFAGNIGDKFSFRTNYYESYGKFPLYINKFIKKTSVVPGQGYIHPYGTDEYEYDLSSGIISYSPSRYINILLGQDKNFIGDGYRSMLLSDVSFNYPFLKLTAYVWDIQYSIMWAQFQEPTLKVTDKKWWPKVYGVFHYLDWNVTNRLSLGFFEAVMWKAVDSVYGYRGFDLNYLDPLILFRPVEYSMGSPDKMKLGMNIKYKVSDQMSFYGQILIDEWTIGEYIKNRGYWANKNALQFGFKRFDIFNVRNLSLVSEFNTASPYTYSHRDPLTAYAQYEQPLADPLGANFYEWVTIASYQINRFEMRAQFNAAIYGADTASVNFGQDIFKSYDTRYRNYGNYTTQGIKTNLIIADLRLAYILNPLLNLRIELGVLYHSQSSNLSSDKSTWITLGLRSSFRNLYYDF